MTQTKVWSDPIDRHKKLAELDLVEGVLLRAINEAQAAWANCTSHHPALYRGIVMWGEAIRSLRDSKIPDDWKSFDEGNQPYVFNPGLNIAITVATGDHNTGRLDCNPSTKSSKGPFTKSAIQNNALANTLFGDIRKNKDMRVTWILLFHRDEQLSEVRCELSLPLKMNSEGHVDEWIDRIPLGPVPFGGTSVRIEEPPQPSPNIEIDVKRRRA